MHGVNVHRQAQIDHIRSVFFHGRNQFLGGPGAVEFGTQFPGRVVWDDISRYQVRERRVAGGVHEEAGFVVARLPKSDLLIQFLPHTAILRARPVEVDRGDPHGLILVLAFLP